MIDPNMAMVSSYDYRLVTLSVVSLQINTGNSVGEPGKYLRDFY